MRLMRPSRQTDIPTVGRRAFHNSTPRQRLGAETYQQEWQTGAYHYNKQTTKNHPVAAQNVNKLLQAYATVRPSKDQGALASRAAIASQRRGMNKVFISGSMAKDFGHKVVVDAFVFDAEKAAGEQDKGKRAGRKPARTGARPAASRTRSGGSGGPPKPVGVRSNGQRFGPQFSGSNTQRFGPQTGGLAYRSLDLGRGSPGAGAAPGRAPPRTGSGPNFRPRPAGTSPRGPQSRGPQSRSPPTACAAPLGGGGS